ncbi:hypothetical protein Xmau_02859 [Xenorhabdus mauleonii]|uniref:DUF2612 domain-containing protein n=1 Tax=Xenorhabdus mauleonii TaxID=351675 RepID=A0A1I3WQV1_9GAMM|nr:DUF2612 domain-containing protein [Xenorhabdus mauleonii]PHM39255.1 hypothetical protein Xmau_02859 [Xenorhabdus mauleonii]SFK09563.1 Protein of unknown function [Xenorhabdus mauleonii]
MRDYLKLITPQHRTALKFVDHIDLITRSLSEISETALQLNEAFSLDYAVGVQLDAVGEWIGLSRYVKTPIVGVYFSFDIEGIGFDQGSWKRRFDGDSGFTELDDETYRTLLRVKIEANHWDGSSEMLEKIYQRILPDNQIFFVDNQDMSMDVFLTGGVIPEIIKSVIRQGYLNIKPQSVRVNNYVNSTSGGLFGFDVHNEYVAGFDTGGWAVKL